MAELIKNAYDADADWVRIESDTRNCIGKEGCHFRSPETGFLLVSDNGAGMSWAGVQAYWMNFSVSTKQQAKGNELTEKKRSPVGGQGLGRLTTARLGEFVELLRQMIGENIVTLRLIGNEFTEERAITEVPLFAEKIPSPREKGTSLLIFPLREVNQWEGDKVFEFIQQLTNKVFLFIDRKSFQIKIKINDQEYELGQSVKFKREENKVYWENVWQKMSPSLIQEVINFWDVNQMIKPGFSSEERAQQVVLILRCERDNKIVGLTTAGVVTFKQLNSKNFYLYRSIILPGYRHPGLTSKLIVETRDFLELANSHEVLNPCIGILTFVENPRIQQFRRGDMASLKDGLYRHG
ncbi:MAG: ATP-binding protein [Flammeovirgaceae bacterium]|nr:ATP-binding protein [Flammeovirgaceae bacterium]